jgi:peroxiredoxin Q/BCP
MTLEVGSRAPLFELPSTEGDSVRLADLLGKKTVVLFFYPKDDSPGCTAEACDFRDNHGRFIAAGAEVLGISTDSIESHQKFAGKHSLPMKLLSDQGGRVAEEYGVKPTLGFIRGRVTFVIDREGIVRYAYSSQLMVTRHVQKALEIVTSLEAGPT